MSVELNVPQPNVHTRIAAIHQVRHAVAVHVGKVYGAEIIPIVARTVSEGTVGADVCRNKRSPTTAGAQETFDPGVRAIAKIGPSVAVDIGIIDVAGIIPIVA